MWRLWCLRASHHLYLYLYICSIQTTCFPPLMVRGGKWLFSTGSEEWVSRGLQCISIWVLFRKDLSAVAKERRKTKNDLELVIPTFHPGSGFSSICFHHHHLFQIRLFTHSVNNLLDGNIRTSTFMEKRRRLEGNFLGFPILLIFVLFILVRLVWVRWVGPGANVSQELFDVSHICTPIRSTG